MTSQRVKVSVDDIINQWKKTGKIWRKQEKKMWWCHKSMERAGKKERKKKKWKKKCNDVI